MRWTFFSGALALSFATLSLATPPEDALIPPKDVEEPTPESNEPELDPFGKPIVPSRFNGQEVPPFFNIEGDKLNDLIAQGNWLVEFFSPYCGHCKRFAPTLQTLYELYYTSKPGSPESADPAKSAISFSKYYDFRFGRVNCVAFGSACSEHGANTIPTVLVLKNGEVIKKSVGTKSLKDISNFLEEALEAIKPGSRPKGGLELPEVGADHTGGDPSAAAPDKAADKTTMDAMNQAAKDAADSAQKKVPDTVPKEPADAAPNSPADTPPKEPAADTAPKKAADIAPKKAADTAPKKAPDSAPKKAGEIVHAAGPFKSKEETTDEKKTKTKKPQPKANINEQGRSVVLSAEEFQRKVTTTRDPWFIKFYTKWCPHCQVLAPTWQSMARDMRGKLNIGEVDCEADKRLCKDVRVQSYPTLVYFQGGERVEYSGMRGLGDLLNFANKASAAGQGVEDVSAAEFEEMEKTEEVIFLYLYDHATTTEDFAALERLLLSLIGRARLVKSNDEKLYKRFKVSTWPRLLVSRDGKPSYYTPLSPREMRDFRKVLGWMQTVWQPIVAELTAANAQEIMSRKLVVLGILSRSRGDEFIMAKREIKNAALEWIDKQTQAFQLERQELRDAKQLRIEEAEDRNDQRALRNAKSIRINMEDIERKEVAFAWVDGVFWERWIRETYGISVKDGERVVVNDEENHRYWDTTITGNPIVPSRTSILETLPKIVASPPKIAPKSTASFFGHIYYSLRHAFLRHPLLTSTALLIALFVALVYSRGAAARRRNNLLIHHHHNNINGHNGNGNIDVGGGGYGDGDGINGSLHHHYHHQGFVGGGGSEKKGWGTGGFFQLPVSGNGKEGGTLGGLLGAAQPPGEKAD